MITLQLDFSSRRRFLNKSFSGKNEVSYIGSNNVTHLVNLEACVSTVVPEVIDVGQLAPDVADVRATYDAGFEA